MKDYKVELKFHEDDATGDWGLLPSNSINIDTPFNSFWTPQGIFHDVFEHYFEQNHRYFTDKYAFNIGGEVAAMGHLAYYWNEFRPEDRQINRLSIYSFEQSIIDSTKSDMQEAISEGYSNYGNELLCAVPKQKILETRGYGLENIIQDHWYEIKEIKPKRTKNDDDYIMNYKKNYKKSITLGKLRSLYTWGWKEAQKIAPWSEQNKTTIDKFIFYWGYFCDQNKAEDLAKWVDKVVFTIKGGYDMSWNADFYTKENEKINYNKLYL